MVSLNRPMLIGNVGTEPDRRYSPNPCRHPSIPRGGWKPTCRNCGKRPSGCPICEMPYHRSGRCIDGILKCEIAILTDPAAVGAFVQVYDLVIGEEGGIDGFVETSV